MIPVKKSTCFPKLIFFLLFFSLVFFRFYYEAEAALIPWDGSGGDALWSNDSNWVGNIEPGVGDVASFDGTACGANCNPTIDTDISVVGVDMSAGTHTITQGAGNTITIGSAGWSQEGAGNIFVGGNSLIQLNGTFTLTSGTFTPTSGTWNSTGGLNLAGGTLIGTGKTLNLNGASGSGLVSCTGDFNTLTGLVVNLSGGYSIDLNTGCTLSALVNSTGSVLVEPSAVFNGTGSTWISGNIGNGIIPTGTINFNGTSFTARNISVPSGGVLNIPNGTTLVVGSTFYGQGDLTIRAGGTLVYGGTNFEVHGYYNALDGTFDESGKNLTLGGNAYSIVNCTGNFNTITGLNSVVLNKETPYLGDNLYFSLGPGCTLTLDSVNSPTWTDDGTVFVEGTLNITGDADFGGPGPSAGAFVNIYGGATVNMTGDHWVSSQMEIGGTFSATTATDVTIYGGMYMVKNFLGVPSYGTYNAAPLTRLIESQDGMTGDFFIYSGTYNNNGSGTLELTNDFSGSSLFNAGTGTVNLNGTTLQNIYGNTTFYNLTATSSIARTLRFTNGTTQIISNELTLKGSSGALISLTSNSTPTQWKINNTGTDYLCYLSVKDSNNLNATALSGYQLTNATGNTNWDFTTTSSCSTPTPPTPTPDPDPDSGSGGGSTGSVGGRKRDISNLLAVNTGFTENMQACLNIAPTLKPASKSFTKNLLFKQTDPDVKVLQMFLNSNNFVVTQKGEGSVGKESNYFGSGTHNALMNFQQVYKKIIEAYFGSIQKSGDLDQPTRDFINSLVDWSRLVCNRLSPPLPPSLPPPILLPPITLPPLPPPIIVEPGPIENTDQNQSENSNSSSSSSDTQNNVATSTSSGGSGFRLSSVLAAFDYPDLNRFVGYVIIPILMLASRSLIVQEKIIRISSFKDFTIILIQALESILSLLGIRGKRKYWGTVYDSKSKQPIDPALVYLIDAQTGKVIEQATTDMAGRYGFLSQSGTFRIEAKKTHYQFPSETVTGNKDEIFDNVYHGEDFTITDTSNVIVPNIPMDQLAFDWNQMDKKRIIKFHPRFEYFLTFIANAFYCFGFALALFNLFKNQTTTNLMITALYIITLIISILLGRLKLWGKLLDAHNVPVPNMLLELAMPELRGVTFGRAKSASDGKFFLKSEKGTYNLNIKKLSGAGEWLQYDMKPVKIKKIGVLNEEVRVG